MFEGFSPETGEFLWELSFHNERPWFQAHKEQFVRCLDQPFKALAQDTAALLRKRFPGEDWQLHVARIYRDARRLFGRGPYKDHLWFSLKSSAGHYSQGPMFWFEIGPAQYSYGLGFFDASPGVMAQFRRSIDAEPARFQRLAEDLSRRRGLRLFGPEYKRPKGSHSPEIDPWYNRRYVAVESAHDHDETLYGPALPKRMVDCFEKLMPMHSFLLQVYRSYTETEER